MFRKYLKLLILLGVLKNKNDSEWRATYFAQTRPKINQATFISGFISLNKKLKPKPYPMPKINDILLKWEYCKYAESLDLSMGYDHIWLIEYESNVCRVINPRGK